jgi:hypothetical protein
MKRIVIAITLLLIAAGNAHGQTPTVQVGQTFTLGWDQPLPSVDQPAPTSYRVELNGSQVGTDLTGGTVRTASMAAIAKCGSNSVRVASIASGVLAWSVPFTFNVIGCPPPAPNNLRIIIALVLQDDGTYRPVITLEEARE